MLELQHYASRFKLIFIDWDGTLSSSRFWGHWQDSPLYGSHYQLIQDRLFRDQPEVINDWMVGRYSAETICEYVASITTLSTRLLLEELESSCRQMQYQDPSIVSAVKHLRESGYLVAIATDNMDTFSRWTIPALGLRTKFDAVLDSHTLRSTKKHLGPGGASPFFDHYLASINVTPSDCLLIDDSAANRAVAEFGMSYTQITPKTPLWDILADIILSTSRKTVTNH